MAARKTLNVSLTSELQRFVKSKVASGRYQTASEVIRDGLRLLEDRERANQRDAVALKRKVAYGLKQARAGRLPEGSDVFAAIRGKLARKPRKVG
jgi:antitoxin ParD1/3/4